MKNMTNDEYNKNNFKELNPFNNGKIQNFSEYFLCCFVDRNSINKFHKNVTFKYLYERYIL